ncbi:unnamed protein product [Mytilus edulis]|uniref:C2H2-type domain-containing protein n=1 Tax=Mytilus edulis TaxID=6550 RepID=A0A8S3TTL4_MYTED|nr:unnamed protein product [Mytilus edulis]
MVCPECYMEFEDITDFEEHRNYRGHCEDTPLEKCRKYNNILLLPGQGHYEINMVKALFKLLWDIGLIDLAKMLGFSSIKALQACQGATSISPQKLADTTAFMFAMAQELLKNYCSEQTNKNEPVSAVGYYQWLSGVQNHNYALMSEIVFTYCLALHVFRAGVRRNNTAAIQTAKVKFSPLFFGLNMSFYMETFVRDLFVRVQCPPEVLAFIEDNESYSVSGNESKGEGGDFILENYNRKTKRLIPAGLPDNNKWLQVCRNVDRLDKVYCSLSTLLGLSSVDEDYMYAYDIGKEISNFRTIIQNLKFLEQKTLKSISGKDLDKDFINFSQKSKEHRRKHLIWLKDKPLGSKHKYEPLFVLPTDREEYDNIANKTKAEISKLVEKELVGLGDQKLDEKWIKIKTKPEMLTFLKEIQDDVD